MVFSSLTFLYLFLPGTMLLYFLVPQRAKNAVLFASSLAFYFFGEQLFLLLMLGEILLAYLAGRLLAPGPRRGRKAVLVLFLALSLGALGLFKYADLFAETVNAAAGRALIAPLRLALPIGISFYTFQCLSYGIDVFRGAYPPERDFLRFALYVSFFPQLIAGPIVRFDAVRGALETRRHSVAGFGAGAARFALGLGKKVLLADRLFAFCGAAAAVKVPSAALAWAEGAAFLLYVYFDFSGYSDMAIGLGRCFGFTIPENFDHPLVSRSVREFWRRWHISLGTWFRDYLYIPLGGNRRGLPRRILNLLLVWALTGLWHGASWNFVVWGLSFGVLLIAETLWDRLRRGPERKRLSFLRVPAVLAAAVLIFVWFRFPSFGDAAAQFGRMFAAPLWSPESAYPLKNALVTLLAAAVGATPLPRLAARRLAATRAGKALAPWGTAALTLGILALTTAWLVDGSFSPFLYFRF